MFTRSSIIETTGSTSVRAVRAVTEAVFATKKNLLEPAFPIGNDRTSVTSLRHLGHGFFDLRIIKAVGIESVLDDPEVGTLTYSTVRDLRRTF